MPIYEYECSTCGHRFEKMVRIGATAPPCPECSAVEVRRLISASAFVLKGGGWYKDHYGLKSDTKSDTKSDKKTETKTDSKPAESKPAESKPSESKAGGAQPSASK